MTIVAYSKGSFKTAFSTSSLPETYGTGSFEVSKKAILFHGKNANGESTYHSYIRQEDRTVQRSKECLISDKPLSGIKKP